MIYLLIEHKVEDFDRWKSVYDEHESARRKAGLNELYILRRTEDPNDVVLFFEGSDPAKARDFLDSEDLKKAMERAGVIGTPVINILEKPALRKAA